MINAKVDDSGVQIMLKELPDVVRARLNKAVHGLVEKLRSHVVRDKLMGQVLNRISGRLGQSIQTLVTQDANSVTGSVFSSGDVKYAAIHEFGFHGSQGVKAHERKITQAFGKTLKEPITINISPFTRQVNMPERSFMRSSLVDMQAEIIASLERAANGKGSNI